MRKFILLFAVLFALTAKALAIDVSIPGSSQAGFNPSNTGTDVPITVAVLNGNPAITCSNCFRTTWIGQRGFTISILGVRYQVAFVTDASNATLTTNYAGSDNPAAATIFHRYIELRWYSNTSFKPLGKPYTIQAGTPDSSSWFARYAASIINISGSNTLFYPDMTIDSTTDSADNNQARYTLGLYLTSGARIQFYTCSGGSSLRIPPNTPTTLADICVYNSTAIVPFDNTAYTRGQIDARLPSCMGGQMVYYDITGNAQSCLNVGSGLLITGNTITSSGGGGAPAGPNTAVQFNSSGVFGGNANFTFNSGTATLNVVGTIQQGSVNVVTISGSQTLTNKTLTTPIIGSFINATHNHENATGGGQLNASNVFSSGTIPLARGGTGSSLADPNAHRLLGWDDIDGQVKFFIIGSGLSYDQGSDTLSATGGGTGDVVGPGSATDNAVARFDGATGKLIQNSVVLIGDTGNVTGLGTLNTHTIPGGTDTFVLLNAGQTLSSKILNNTNSFSGYFDMVRIAAPASPSSGNLRIFANNGTGKLACVDNAGADCMPAGGGGGGMSIGGAVTGATAQSVLFVASGPVLAEDAGVFVYDAAANSLAVGTNSFGTGALTLSGASATDFITFRTPASAVTGTITLDNSSNSIRLIATGANDSVGMGVATGTGVISIASSGETTITPVVRNGVSASPAFRVLTPADLDLPAATESFLIQFGGNAALASVTRNFLAAGPGNQREYIFIHPTYVTDDGSDFNNAVTVTITGRPSGDVVVAEALALSVSTGNSRFGGDVNITGSLDVDTAVNIDGSLIVDTTALVSGAFTAAVGASVGGQLAVDNGIDVITGTTALTTASIFPGAFLDAANAEIVDVFFGLDREVNFVNGTTLATQRSVRFTAPTFSADAAKTITLAATAAFSGPPIAGPNVTIGTALNTWFQAGAVRFGTPSTSTGSIQLAVSGDANFTAVEAGTAPVSNVRIQMPNDDPAAGEVWTITSFSGGIAVTEWAAGGGGGGCSVAGSQGDYQINSGAGGCAAGVITQGTNGRVIASPTLTTSGAVSYFRIVTPVDTGQTADAEMPGIVLGGSAASGTIIRTGADGTTIALQREVRIVEPTYAFAAATTITRAVTLQVDAAPIQGTNAILTNALAFRVASGSSEFPAGTSTSPSIRLTSVNSGIFSESGTVSISVGTAYIGGYNFGGGVAAQLLTSTSVILWSNVNNSITTTTDVGLARHAAGVIRVMDGGGSSTPGQLLVGNSGDTIGAQLDVRSQATGTIGLRVDSIANSTVDLADFNLNADDTSTAAPILGMFVNSNGAPANGFGGQFYTALETTTTQSVFASSTTVRWSDVTHATRTSEIVHNLVEGGTAADVFFLRGNGQIRYYGLKQATAQLDKTNSAAFSNITGLSVNIVSGRTYKVKVEIYFDIAADTNGGAKITLGGTSSASTVLGTGYGIDTSSATTDVIPNSAFRFVALTGNLATTGAATGVLDGVLRGEATVVCNGSGTLTVQGAQVSSNGDTTSFLVGSTMEVWEISN